ncbi:MAG: peptidoglycan-binding protein [Lachnospiraceae bacterium]
MNTIKAMQQDHIDKGKLRIRITSAIGYLPVADASIRISLTGGSGQILEEVKTNSSGQTEEIILDTPPLEYSLTPQENQPYAEYTLQVQAEGYQPREVAGTEILSGETALQDIELEPVEMPPEREEDIVIGPHTLFGDYPPKIAEAEIKPLEGRGEIVLSRVVVPEYVIVHDGVPTDSTANDYYVRYSDYIKNVASSEIYATWPESTIQANVLAIMSFTLNRVYTEWYRGKGYDFTITSSTAFDHKWIYGRNIFRSISDVVDDLFANYLSRPNVTQPILTQYCDGKRVTCPNWMSQWGSKYLGDQDYTASEILRYYYGSSIYINEADEIAGIPASWPGEDLTLGSTGPKVRQMQEQLNAIANAYPEIKKVTADGIYGPRTEQAVRTFQRLFDLPVTGEVDYPTWYKISQIYVGVTRIAEPY